MMPQGRKRGLDLGWYPCPLGVPHFAKAAFISFLILLPPCNPHGNQGDMRKAPLERLQLAVGLIAKEALISFDSLNPSEFPWKSGELVVGLFGKVGTSGRTRYMEKSPEISYHFKDKTRLGRVGVCQGMRESPPRRP
jgi:hypothetical protein